MKNILTLLSLLLIVWNTNGQESTIKKFDFFTSVNMGMTSDFNNSNLSGTITNGVLINNRFSAALGVGMEGNQNGRQLPIFLEGKYILFNKKDNTPFISVMSGYLQPLERNYWQNIDGGFTAGVQIGYQNFFSENVGIATSIGYRYWSQQGTQGYYYDIIAYPEPIYYYISNRFELRLSLIFK